MARNDDIENQALSPKTAVAIRHVHFEDLGSFEGPLNAAGYQVHYLDPDGADLAMLDPLLPDLLIILGGPIGVGDGESYPCIIQEQRLLNVRLAARRPTLGICLGAQQMAAVLGASVVPMGHKEIGFSQLTLTDAGRVGPLRHLEGVAVLHWHGDAFQIPDGADHLAATDLCATQAFAVGKTILGLQFHPEVDVGAGMERWLIGHAAELAGAGINPCDLRADAARFGVALHDAAHLMFVEWLDGLEA